MSKVRRQAAFSTTAVVLALSLITFAAVPTEAWARPGSSYHESNQGEVDKSSLWTKIMKALKVHIVRPVAEAATGRGSSPVCH
jgi:hypothetical protein